MRIGALEAGGTKMVCAIGDETGKIYEQISVPTMTPEETMPVIIEYFKEKEIEALGIGCFGPVDLDRNSNTYGTITTTPKLAWRNYDIVGIIKKELKIPIGFNTDVNGSALGEASFGSTKGLDNSIYFTIGTGIGAGVYLNHKLHHGMQHPEAGHMLIARHPDDTYAGKCPYHNNCLEGLASGPAIEERWGKKAYELSDQKEVWELEAYYLAQAIVNAILTLSPRRIVLGGGIMHQMQLFPLIRVQVKELLGGYVVTEELKDMDSYLVPAALNDDQGIIGCLVLAMQALESESLVSVSDGMV